MATTSKPTLRTYSDSSVYLAVFLGPDREPNFDVAQAAILTAEQGLTEGYISGLVMAEVIGAPRLRGENGAFEAGWEERVAKALNYFRATTFRYVEEAQRVGIRAAEIAAEFALRGADAMHLALAEQAGVDEFYSLDKAHLRVKDRLPGMRVMRPYGDPQAAFDLAD